jgi:hypothetical protein
MAGTLITHRVGDSVIPHRVTDGYVSATFLCQATGKRVNDYLRLDSTQGFLEELARVEGVPVTGNPATGALVQVQQGGTPERQGTWVHPDVAIHLAQWCSAKFAVLVSKWVRDWLTSGMVPNRQAKVTLTPYSDRVRLSWGVRSNIPPGYWSVFTEGADLLITAEEIYVEAGLEMDRFDLLDGSVGMHWPRYRAMKPWERDRIPYGHPFPDRRGVRDAWAYEMSELPHFRSWLYNVYVPGHFTDYLQRKYGPSALARALPVFRRRGVRLALPCRQ